MKKIFLILIILFINSCGYTPLYSSKDSNYKVISLKSNIGTSLTNYIQNSIKALSNENAEKKFNISFDYSEEITVILKDAKGDPSKNRLKIEIDLSLFDAKNSLISTKKFSESFELDYTEFPAQILEHWVSQPEMLAMYAKHYQTGEVIPIELVEKIRAAANHNQGFKTTEYVAASLLDLAWHSLSVEEAQQITEARAFEREVLENYGLIDEIEPRYRSQYFSHIFAGGYSAGYYAYLWSEILDADGFTAFKQAEDIWDPELAGRLKRWVYEAGGLRPADELYRNFRGQDPSIEPLLEGRGFIDTPSPDA